MNEKVVGMGYTFDDVLLKPAYSEVLPAEADTKTKFSRNISLNIPLSSAAMDTVTEARLAIALAQLGGIGVIHKNVSIQEQADEVAKVKRSESGLVIVDPVTVSPRATITEAINIMAARKISGIPVVDAKGMLVGIITSRDLRFESRRNILVSEIMTKKVRTAPVGTTLEGAKEILQKYRVEKLPVVDKNKILRGLITVRDIQNTINYPKAAKDSNGRLRVAAAIGAGGDYLERAALLIENGVDALVIDTAHGHSKGVLKALKMLKLNFGHTDIIAGNIATKEGARGLIDAGADAIKIGMGPGSICTTRVVTGAGVPQVSAIMDCAAQVGDSGVPVIADGGIKFSGDITKAIVAGADSVMIGSLFAGVTESPGDVILYQGKRYKAYRGMGSLGAMKQGSASRYGQDPDAVDKHVPEGIEGQVASKGDLAALVTQFIGGLAAGMGYAGCRTIQELKDNAEFIQITAAGLSESHVHDVVITKEAPNYQRG